MDADLSHSLSRIAAALISLLALLSCGLAHGYLFPLLGLQLSPQIKSGTVMMRAQMLV